MRLRLRGGLRQGPQGNHGQDSSSASEPLSRRRRACASVPCWARARRGSVCVGIALARPGHTCVRGLSLGQGTTWLLQERPSPFDRQTRSPAWREIREMLGDLAASGLVWDARFESRPKPARCSSTFQAPPGPKIDTLRPAETAHLRLRQGP